ncbi:MAG: ParB/RepB/Spo0J family partition protein [Bacteriovoracaceae bacterium]|nr:ParB/RepB/Spo0J family partition protein [Bacteriovoracaceae bacterium]
MAKEFAARLGKKDRKVLDISGNVDEKVLRLHDQKLLRGAQLDHISLKDIVVRDQVRTKFNDDSLRELADNIKENGLIQPLVIHREGNKFVLICGERRFRAMTLINLETAPCFILEDKTPEELMAIQFSENQAREDLHYIDQADSIFGYQKLTGASERKITASLGISKSEVHRCLQIAKMPKDMKEAAKKFNTEKYVLLEWDELPLGAMKDELRNKVLAGEVTKRLQLKRQLSLHNYAKQKKSPNQMDHLMKEMKSQLKDPKFQAKARAMMKQLIKETTLQ